MSDLYCDGCEICEACQNEWSDTTKLDKEIADLKSELLLTKNSLANATAKLHGTRQHVTEVTMK